MVFRKLMRRHRELEGSRGMCTVQYGLRYDSV